MMHPRMVSAVLLGIVIQLACGSGCGPERAYAPPLDEIGAKPVPPPVPPEGSLSQPAGSNAFSAAPQPGVPGNPPIAPPAPAGSEFSFLDPLAAKAAETAGGQNAPLAVLPAFHLNPTFRRFEVSQLGEDLAAELIRKVQAASGGKAAVLAPEQFKIQLRSTNRSLADADSPEAAVALTGRLGIRHLVRGIIQETGDALTIRYEGIDAADASQWAVPIQKTIHRGEPGAEGFFRRFKDASGQVVLGSQFRIGPMAEPEKPSLQRELQWIFSQAVEGLLAEGGAGLKDDPLAVLPTQVPSQITFQRQVLAMRRAIADETERLKKLGLDEAKAMGEGPVRILGKNYLKLREASDAVREMEAASALSDTGELRSTLSRLIFDRVESLGERAGIEVIPHDQLINETVAFSREEVEKIKDGILDEKTQQLFKTQGAKTLLFNELIESGDSYDFVFQIRRLDNLKKVTSQLRAYLEPRFAMELRQFLKKN